MTTPTPQRQLYFAARRCFYTDGDVFLDNISLETGKKLSITETRLIARGISLGTFFYCTQNANKKYTDFEVAKLPNLPQVELEGNFAKVTNLTAELINYNGTLVFNTEMFGLIRPQEQLWELGKYRISMRISTSSENTQSHMDYFVLSQEHLVPNPPQKQRAPAPPIPPSRTFLPVVEAPPPPVHLPRTLSSPIAPEDPFSPPINFSELSLDTLPDVRQLVAQVAAARRASPLIQGVLDDTELPQVPYRPEARAPMKLENLKELRQEPKPTVVGEGFNVSVPKSTMKNMKAFVTNVTEQNKQCHFLWICDEPGSSLREAIFYSEEYKLEPGHFFEGRFLLQNDGRWKCLKYLQPISPLFGGSLVRGHIEIIGTIAEHYEAEEKGMFPMVKVENLGIVIDNNYRLSTNCVGRQIKTQRFRVEGQMQWVVLRML